jgi:hypothetical protein
MELETISHRWNECIVAATGPSLTPEVAEQCRYAQVIAVNDAYKLMPWAAILFACDAKWWNVHNGCPGFTGEKWSTHGKDNDKTDVAERYGVRCVRGSHEPGFSYNPSVIHYGSNSGFQAINLAILLGATVIKLVGFDMQSVGGKRHFFGNHPAPLSNFATFETFIGNFRKSARTLPKHIKIINCTPGSALKCFPFGTIEPVHEYV